MQYDDLNFTIEDGNGNEIICDIISMLPKSNTESYIVFTDGSLDENGDVILKYGKLIKVNDEFELDSNVDENELNSINEKFYNDVVAWAHSYIDSEE